MVSEEVDDEERGQRVPHERQGHRGRRQGDRAVYRMY